MATRLTRKTYYRRFVPKGRAWGTTYRGGPGILHEVWRCLDYNAGVGPYFIERVGQKKAQDLVRNFGWRLCKRCEGNR